MLRYTNSCWQWPQKASNYQRRVRQWQRRSTFLFIITDLWELHWKWKQTFKQFPFGFQDHPWSRQTYFPQIIPIRKKSATRYSTCFFVQFSNATFHSWGLHCLDIYLPYLTNTKKVKDNGNNSLDELFVGSGWTPHGWFLIHLPIFMYFTFE